jgi:hypothetical protein
MSQNTQRAQRLGPSLEAFARGIVLPTDSALTMEHRAGQTRPAGTQTSNEPKSVTGPTPRPSKRTQSLGSNLAKFADGIKLPTAGK